MVEGIVRPFAVGEWAGGGGVNNGGDLWGETEFFGDADEIFLGVLADADEPFGLKDFEGFEKVLIAGVLNGVAVGFTEFVGSEVSSGFGHEDERTVVGDELVGKEIVGIGEADCDEFGPEAAAADFDSSALKASDGAFGVFVFRFGDGSGDFHPIADGGNRAKGNADLGHAKRAGIHSEEEDTFGAAAKTLEVDLVWFPGIVERIVGMGDGWGDIDLIDGMAKIPGCVDEGLGVDILRHEE